MDSARKPLGGQELRFHWSAKCAKAKSRYMKLSAGTVLKLAFFCVYIIMLHRKYTSCALNMHASYNTYLHMLLVILVNNGKKDVHKYVHADNNETDKEQAGPRIVVISRHPSTRKLNKYKILFRT